MTYAATGEGCTGAVGSATALGADEAAPDAIPAIAITSPVRHGAYLFYPAEWDGGEAEPETVHTPPAPDGGTSGSSEAATAEQYSFFRTRDIAEARQRIAYWRDPVLPAGWAFRSAETDNGREYCAFYNNEMNDHGVDLCVHYKKYRPFDCDAVANGGRVLCEPRTFDGRAVLVRYSPRGPAYDRLLGIMVFIFDANTGIEYWVLSADRNMRGSNIEPVIAIARSLLPPTGSAP